METEVEIKVAALLKEEGESVAVAVFYAVYVTSIEKLPSLSRNIPTSQRLRLVLSLQRGHSSLAEGIAVVCRFKSKDLKVKFVFRGR